MSEDITEKICRSCLKVDKQMKNIFEDAEGRLPMMIKDCTSIKVMPNDGLPDSLCSECEEKLTAAFAFRKFFKNNDQALRAHLNVTVKEDQDHDDQTQHSLEDDIIHENDLDEETAESELDKEDKEEKLKFRCDKCPKVFVTARARSHHCNKMHEGEDSDFEPDTESVISKDKSYKCSDCDMKFSRQHLLMKHQREMHLEVSMQENNEIKMEIPDEDEEENDDDEDDEFYDDDIEEDGKYPCEVCSKEFTSSFGLKIHMKKHSEKRMVDCTECGKRVSKYQLKNHIKMVHSAAAEQRDGKTPNKREMQCEFCDRRFKYKKSFTQHMAIEHGIDVDEDDLIVEPIIKRKRRSGTFKDKEDSDSESDSNDDKNSSRILKCPICNSEFGRTNHLSRHMQLHRDVMPHKCDKCEDAFMTVEELQKHLARHENKPYKCFACSKGFTRGEHYIRHIKTHDNPLDGKPLHCPICPETGEGIKNLCDHVKVHLASDKKHVCNVCGRSFNRADNLKTHVKSHKAETAVPKLHLCIYCGKEFNNSSNMIVHMRRHTGERPYKCKICGKGFPRSHDLKCHERTHSGEKPYLCTLCGKCFNKSNKLLRHSRVHTGERPYVCSICARAFTQSNDLALHMRRHTGARPYACGVCPARFIQSGQLKAHQRSKGHWAETAPDLKGSYRVEPVKNTGESKPIRFRRTASGHKYEPPNFTDHPPPLPEQQQSQAGLAPTQSLQQGQVLNQTPHKELTLPTAVPTTVPLIVPAPVSTNNVHLVQGQSTGQNVHMDYNHTHAQLAQPQQQIYESYGKVQTENLVVVPVHSHTPTSTTGTFQDENVACSENSNAFSPTDASYECRSYS